MLDFFGNKAKRDRQDLAKKAADEIHGWQKLCSTCVFCGYVSQTGIDGLRSHLEDCEKHPLTFRAEKSEAANKILTEREAQLKDDLETLNKRLEELAPRTAGTGKFVFRMRHDENKMDCEVAVAADSKTKAKEMIAAILHRSWRIINISKDGGPQ